MQTYSDFRIVHVGFNDLSNHLSSSSFHNLLTIFWGAQAESSYSAATGLTNPRTALEYVKILFS